MSDYSDPYNFNYATPIKNTKVIPNFNNPEERNIPGKNFNVFNPNRPKQPIENTNHNPNFKNINLNTHQNEHNKFDELQGTIDLDKNAYEKPVDKTYDDGEEIPLLEGKF